MYIIHMHSKGVGVCVGGGRGGVFRPTLRFLQKLGIVSRDLRRKIPWIRYQHNTFRLPLETIHLFQNPNYAPIPANKHTSFRSFYLGFCFFR